MRMTLLAALTAALSSALLAQEDPAKPSRPAPHPAREALRVALGKASADHQRVVAVATLDDGGSAEAFQALAKKDRTLSRYLLYEYQQVVLPLAAIAEDKKLAPLTPKDATELLVLDATGKLLARTDLAAMLAETDAGASITTWLTPFQAPPVDAREALAEALASAVASERRVLVHLGAPW